MSPLLIVGGLALLFIVLEKQQAALFANLSRTNRQQQSGPSLASIFGSTQSGMSDEQKGLAIGATTAGAFGSLASSGALGAGLQASKAIPIIGSVIGIATSILGGIFAAHAKKVKEEAETLDSAVPRWRTLLKAISESYNSGDVGAQEAIDYVAKAKDMYYSGVAQIKRGDPGGGAPASGYFAYTGSHPGTPPVDPCNGACYIGFYWVEPEAQIVVAAITQAERTGQPVQFSLKSFTVRNGLVQPSLSLVFKRP